MRYTPPAQGFDRVLRESRPLRELLYRKAAAGAAFWRANSRVRTGFNASAVRVVTGERNGKRVAVIYAWGHYARFREHGTRYNAAERVLRRSVPSIKAQS
ncbi:MULTISPECIES: hypothetical protein [unclassified Nocardia]|uniref:hypothetical protein n=1 Tax=unclassified Nocardia TaxID=2637762 RepID=UPI00278C425B|nr:MULTISPECIES: hypothetical protein [unclassified Nocardia]